MLTRLKSIREKIQNRRQNDDPRMRVIRYLGFACWVLFYASVLIIGTAAPEWETGYDQQIGKTNAGWDRHLIDVLAFVLSGGLALSLIGLLLNSTRHRRKSDRYLRSFFIMGGFSAIGLTTYFFF